MERSTLQDTTRSFDKLARNRRFDLILFICHSKQVFGVLARLFWQSGFVEETPLEKASSRVHPFSLPCTNLSYYRSCAHRVYYYYYCTLTDNPRALTTSDQGRRETEQLAKNTHHPPRFSTKTNDLRIHLDPTKVPTAASTYASASRYHDHERMGSRTGPFPTRPGDSGVDSTRAPGNAGRGNQKARLSRNVVK